MKNLALALLTFAPVVDVHCAQPKKSSKQQSPKQLGFSSTLLMSIRPSTLVSKSQPKNQPESMLQSPATSPISEESVMTGQYELSPSKNIQAGPNLALFSEPLSLPTETHLLEATAKKAAVEGAVNAYASETIAPAEEPVQGPVVEPLPLPSLPLSNADYHKAYGDAITPILELVAQTINSDVRTVKTPDYSRKTQQQLRNQAGYALRKLTAFEADHARAAQLNQQALQKEIAALNAQGPEQQELLQVAKNLKTDAARLVAHSDLKHVAILRNQLLAVMSKVYVEPAQQDPILSQANAMKRVKGNKDVANLPEQIGIAVRKSVNDMFQETEAVPQSHIDAIVYGLLPIATIDSGYSTDEVTFLKHLSYLASDAKVANPHRVADIIAHRAKLAAVLKKFNGLTLKDRMEQGSFETEALPQLPSLEGVTTLAQAVELLTGKNDQGRVTNELMANLPAQRKALDARIQETADSIEAHKLALSTEKTRAIHNTDSILAESRAAAQLKPQLDILQAQLDQLDTLINVRNQAVAALHEHFAPKPVQPAARPTTSSSTWLPSFGSKSLSAAVEVVSTRKEQTPLTIQQVFANVVEEQARKKLSEEQRGHELRMARYAKGTAAQVDCYQTNPRVPLKKLVQAGYPLTLAKGFSVNPANLAHAQVTLPAEKGFRSPTLTELMRKLMPPADLQAWKQAHEATEARMQQALPADEDSDHEGASAPAQGDALATLQAAAEQQH